MIVVATSPHTPKTTEYITKKIKNNLNNLNNLSNSPNKIREEYIETPGKGYIEDLSYLLERQEKNSKNNVLVMINVDLPFISSTIIDNVLEEYFKSEKIAMSVQVPIAIYEKLGIKPTYESNGFVPSGLNILISRNIEQVEEKLIIPKVELALNINTLEDIDIAKKILKNTNK